MNETKQKQAKSEPQPPSGSVESAWSNGSVSHFCPARQDNMISCHDSPVALLDTNIIGHQGEEQLSGLTLSRSQFIHSYACHLERATRGRLAAPFQKQLLDARFSSLVDNTEYCSHTTENTGQRKLLRPCPMNVHGKLLDNQLITTTICGKKTECSQWTSTDLSLL